MRFMNYVQDSREISKFCSVDSEISEFFSGSTARFMNCLQDSGKISGFYSAYQRDF